MAALTNMTAYPIANGYAPIDGSKLLVYTFSFDAAGVNNGNTIEDDFLIEESMGVLDFIQTVHIRNTSAFTFTLSAQGIGLPISVATMQQAILPFYCKLPARFRGILPAIAPTDIVVGFLNIPMASIIWPVG